MTPRASLLAYSLKEMWPLNTSLWHIASLLLESGVRAITACQIEGYGTFPLPNTS